MQGLKAGAVVRLSGKDVGRVESVEFVGEMIEVTLRGVARTFVRSSPTGPSAAVGALSLLGESFVDDQGRARAERRCPTGVRARHRDRIVASLTETASARNRRGARKLIADVRAGRGTLGKLVTDDALYKELKQFVASAGEVTEETESGQGHAGRLINDPAAFDALKASLENLQQMTARINSGQGALGRFLNDEAMGRSLSGTMTNLEKTTGRLNRGEGTMGKLLTDRQLYDRLDQMTGPRRSRWSGGSMRARALRGSCFATSSFMRT